jgi:UDP-N-acetylmuramate--alanine ligase
MVLVRQTDPPAVRGPAAPFAAPHLVGIGGSGMQSLAALLRDLGCRVTGSDARFAGGHCESQVPADCDALVYSPAVPPDNPERTAAAALGIPQLSLVDVLALLMQSRTGVCIAGTHGKSTTTALTAWILRHAGREPSAFIGASLHVGQAFQPDREGDVRQAGRLASGQAGKPDLRGGWAGSGELFIVESCEYRRHFLRFTPEHAVILNIEPDHFDTFPDEAALLDGFRQFAASVPASGTLLVNGDCERCKSVAELARVQTSGRKPRNSCEFRYGTKSLETFGSTAGCNWRFADVQQTATGTRFRIVNEGHVVTDVDSPLFGTHNVYNALAAAAFCLRLGVSAAEVRDAVREFPGISRRFAPLGEWRGMAVFADYAHHPTAVRVTLETARQRFGGRRVWCVFQPHQLLRTQRLMDEFAAALALADCVLVPPVFAARENASGDCERISQLLVERTSALMASSRSCRPCASLDHVLPTLDDEARPGDVVILMGAGDIERIGHELAGRIPPDHAGR